jgi:hypothetical protein
VATSGAGATYSIQYGTTSALGHTVTGTLGGSTASLAATLRNLRAGGAYYVRAVVSNAAGSTTTPTIRFKTSAVTIGRITIHGNRLHAVLRCHGSRSCRVRLQAHSGSRLIGSGWATVRGNRTTTVTLTLRSHHGHVATKLSALSSWNGYSAAVTATA